MATRASSEQRVLICGTKSVCGEWDQALRHSSFCSPPRPSATSASPHKSALSAAKMVIPPARSLPRPSPSSSWPGAWSHPRRGAIRQIRKIREIRFPLVWFSRLSRATAKSQKQGRGFDGFCGFGGSAPCTSGQLCREHSNFFWEHLRSVSRARSVPRVYPKSSWPGRGVFPAEERSGSFTAVP